MLRMFELIRGEAMGMLRMFELIRGEAVGVVDTRHPQDTSIFIDRTCIDESKTQLESYSKPLESSLWFRTSLHIHSFLTLIIQ